MLDSIYHMTLKYFKNRIFLNIFPLLLSVIMNVNPVNH